MKKTLRPILIGFTVIALIYGGTWHYFSRQFEQHIEQQLALIQAKGFDVSFEKLKISGFPFSYDVKVNKLEVRRSDEFRTWVDGDMVFSAKLWKPLEISSVAGRTHHLTFDGFALEGKGFRLKSFTFDPLRFRFSYDDLLVLINGQESFKANKLEYDIDFMEENGKTTAGLNIKLEELEAPVLKSTALGNKIEQILLKANLQGELKGDSAFERLTTWFESDGTMDVQQASLKWGELTLTAEGTFSVDKDLQPIAAFTATIEGLDKVIDILVEQGTIERHTADLVKVGVGFLGGDDSKIAFSIQDRKFMLGTIPISDIPRIEWK